MKKLKVLPPDIKKYITNIIDFHIQIGENFTVSTQKTSLQKQKNTNNQQLNNNNNKLDDMLDKLNINNHKIKPQILTTTTKSTNTHIANNATSLSELKQIMENFDECSLKKSAINLVFADGNSNSNIMAIGEAPGAEEDKSGIPFRGRAGRLLDLMFKAIKLNRSNIYIANIIPWRPPGNRPPTPQEIALCLPFIHKHIELINPEIIICLGGSAAKALLNTNVGITKIRGKWQNIQINGKNIKVMPTLHPAYLLRQPLQKKVAWLDLLTIKKQIDSQKI